MVNKSNVDIAFDIVSNCSSPIAFADLFNKLCEVQEYSDDQKMKKISDFYTSLLLDGRFINLGDNTWDLRSRYTFDKVKLDMSECYSDDDEEISIDPEEKEEGEEEVENDDEEGSEYEPEIEE